MTQATEITARVIAALNQAGIPHMLVGAFSRNAYAHARATQDADLVVVMTGHTLAELMRALGPDFSLEEQTTFETNTGTMRDTLVAGETGFKIELFHLSADAHDQERFRRRNPTTFGPHPTSIPPPEDVIITKLRWLRHKDREDIKDIIAYLGAEALDWNYLHHWTDHHGTRAKLDAIRAEVPQID
ncbi:hypothetical protein LBMAG56_23730 [Verrucomicrobiota bacterium]|nr:hypothetical protein LBMAG56_23730 [Verrucomicrobiota bacterium]